MNFSTFGVREIIRVEVKINLISGGPVHINDMQTCPPSPPSSKRGVFIFWYKMTRNALKRMKNEFSYFCEFLIFEIWSILNHLDTPYKIDFFIIPKDA